MTLQDHPGVPDFLKVENRGKTLATGKPLVYSYTFLNTYYNVCPYQAQQRYITKTVPYKETPEMKWGNAVHSAFEHRVGAGVPLPEGMRHWEPFAAPFDGKSIKPEMKLGVTVAGKATGFWDADVWLRGKLDVPLIQGNTAYLGDWKTGKSSFEDRFELDVQAVMLHAQYPNLTKIYGQFFWLKENRVGQLFDLSNTQEAWTEINDIVKELQHDLAEGTFKKKKSGLCSWCDCFECENNTNPKKPA